MESIITWVYHEVVASGAVPGPRLPPTAATPAPPPPPPPLAATWQRNDGGGDSGSDYGSAGGSVTSAGSADGETDPGRRALDRRRAAADRRRPQGPLFSPLRCGLTGNCRAGNTERKLPKPSRRGLLLRPQPPRPCKAAVPKGPAFSFLNYYDYDPNQVKMGAHLRAHFHLTFAPKREKNPWEQASQSDRPVFILRISPDISFPLLGPRNWPSWLLGFGYRFGSWRALACYLLLARRGRVYV